jgi:alpha-tubulin suppressor-like RCC1 family protein
VRRARALWGIVAAGAALAVACNAIVGVEDVHLARALDGGFTQDDADIPDEGTPPDATPATPDAQVDLALGFLHTCARRLDGTVQCWGEDGTGELGDGIPFDGGSRPPALVPQPVVGVSDAVAIASGVSHSCIARKGGSVSCWGYNFFGQLGDGTNTKSSSPVTVLNVSDAVSVAAGTSFSCALLRSGTVSCWGANYSGQLGDGTKNDRPTAAPVQGLSNAVSIALAETHACAIVSGGTVSCWGENAVGQLGNGSLAESLSPAPIASLSDIVQIAAASLFTCARQRSGQVYCWGSNSLGQLGNGSPNDSPNPSPLLTAVNDAIWIWTGYEHACAVRKSGAVACWGRAADGQVGSGATAPDASIANPTTVIGVSGALAVSTGGDHSCATTRAGEVYCWGSNTLGEVGDGTKNTAYSAVKVGGYP